MNDDAWTSAPAPETAPAPVPAPAPAPPTLRGLDGVRYAFLGSAAVVILATAATAGRTSIISGPPPMVLLGIFGAAAVVVQFVASIVWVVRAVGNQKRLDHPVPGRVWLPVIAGSLLPFVGPLFLFDFADRTLKASAEAARPAYYDRPSWFVPWFVTYLAAATLGTLLDFLPSLAARRWLFIVVAVLLGAAWFGLARFLKTVEENQEEALAAATAAAADTRIPPVQPWESQATAIPDDA